MTEEQPLPAPIDPQAPDLIHGNLADRAEAPTSPAQVEVRKASTFSHSTPVIVKDKDKAVLTLCQIELAELSAACGWLNLSADSASYHAKLGGIIAGLIRVHQRLAPETLAPTAGA